MAPADRRFVTPADAAAFRSPWALEEWLCRADVVDNKHLLLVRATMDARGAHPFHTHPTREELIYVLAGRAEQWVGQDRRLLRPGDMAFIPMGEVHATFNPHDQPLVFLAILSPSDAPDPGIVDVSTEEPWASLRKP